jgi:hypothetical protein
MPNPPPALMLLQGPLHEVLGAFALSSDVLWYAFFNDMDQLLDRSFSFTHT